MAHLKSDIKGLSNTLVMQGFMASQQGNVIAVQQPVDLFTGQRHQLIRRPRPFELFFSQGFVIEHKAVVLPHQALDLVPLPVGEGIEGSGEGAVAQFLLHQQSQAIRLLAEVDGLSVQIDLRQIPGRA